MKPCKLMGLRPKKFFNAEIAEEKHEAKRLKQKDEGQKDKDMRFHMGCPKDEKYAKTGLPQIQRIHHDDAEEDQDDDEQDGHEFSGVLNILRLVTGLLVHQYPLVV
jgi:hypothetical protein